MITRRRLIRSIGGLSALGISTAAYGVAVEPVLRLRVTRYHPTPRQWPADLPLKIAVIADVHACDPGCRWSADIKCRKAGLKPDRVVVDGDHPRAEDARRRQEGRSDARRPEGSPRRGVANLQQHIENIKKFGLPCSALDHRFSADTDAEIALVSRRTARRLASRR